MYARKMSVHNSVDNILFLTDSYKISHHKQYPPSTSFIYSYFESRGGKFDEVVFFGLQYIIKQWLVGPVVTHAKVDEAKLIYDAHLGPGIFNEADWRYIVDFHKGHLPLRIKAVPEGTVVPVKNVLFTVENTDPKLSWLTNFFETVLVQVWYPMTVATMSREMKKIIAGYLHDTADNIDGLPFKLHDFGYRGASSVESASLGGGAHLVNFSGTDTIAALLLARRFYSAEMPGYSIPASEHSTITSWGKDGEVDAFKNMLTSFPNGLVACVSDSYDLYRAVSDLWGGELKTMIEERNGTLVVRPDSGVPSEVVLKVLEILGDKFGTTLNSKGYKMLPACIRVIQGDGIDYESMGSILENIKKYKWSTENVVFGCGGGLLQRLDRDTQRCAMKCSHAVINDKGVNVFKQPATDISKASKKGRLTLERSSSSPDAKLVTKVEGTGDASKDLLVTVFENGKLLIDYKFQDIRDRAKIPLEKTLN